MPFNFDRHSLMAFLHYTLQNCFIYFFNYSAVDADVMIVKEIGLDPGIDHMLAMECFDDIRDGGAKVGGL